MSSVNTDWLSVSARYSAGEPHRTQPREVRADIQGLRALAVLSVLLFHIWPEAVPGGFVGVDVFFVISGYLITGLLFRELETTGRISLFTFYAKRMKRLLPAASLVLIAIVLAIPLLPPARWEDVSIDVLASALYVENWHLAWLATDYFGSENAPSPVRHYWSLSVEEQFYILWPVIMILAAGNMFQSAGLRRRIIVPLAAMTALSLGAAIWLTETNLQAAYFVTHTRLWELTLGGLMAVVVIPAPSARLAEGMRITGLGAILLSVFAYSPATPFPGYAALLPTLGCALVIAAGDKDGRWAGYQILALRPAQYIGGISYSLYLWHWPLIAFAALYFAEGFNFAQGIALLAASFVLADLTKRFVEDPARNWSLAVPKTFALGVVSILACVLSATYVYRSVALQMIESHRDSPDYPGARALFENASVPKVDSPIPPLALMRKDRSAAYRRDCHVDSDEVAADPCLFGKEDGVRVIHYGDSHAANWIPALAEIAEQSGWRLETHTRSACSIFKKMAMTGDQPDPLCKLWGENVMAELSRSPPEIVIMTQSQSRKVVAGDTQPDDDATAAATAEVWRELLSLGVKVVAIRDTPQLPFKPDECLLRNLGCYAKQSEALSYVDPILIAHRMVPEVPIIDMTDALCHDGRCPMIIGNIVVWRDTHHLTASYARSAASVLGERIMSALQHHERARYARKNAGGSGVTRAP